jgi:hypothetical protein
LVCDVERRGSKPLPKGTTRSNPSASFVTQKYDRRIFTDRVPGLAAPIPRRISRLVEIVPLLGRSAGGRPLQRLMRRLRMPVSDDFGQREAPPRQAIYRKWRLRRYPRGGRLGVAAALSVSNSLPYGLAAYAERTGEPGFRLVPFARPHFSSFTGPT